MKKHLLALSIVIVMAGCNEQPAPETGVVAEQVKVDAASVPVLPEWINGNKVTAPLNDIVDGSETYKAVSYCMPHHCASDFMITLTGKDKKAYSLVVHVEDTEGAMLTPSQYATYQYIGEPDAKMKALLQQALKQDPNWK